jgi:hypothetical protein
MKRPFARRQYRPAQVDESWVNPPATPMRKNLRQVLNAHEVVLDGEWPDIW